MNISPTFLATVMENGLVVETYAARDDLIFGIICLLIGLFNLFCPYGAWFLGYGWRYENAEPSDLALIATRIIGGFIALIGTFFLLR